LAKEQNVPLIDLSAASSALYEALGTGRAPLAFSGVDPKRDPTHHNSYGAYELAKCVIQSLTELKLPIATSVVQDFTGFNPNHPDSPDEFGLSASPRPNGPIPLGRAAPVRSATPTALPATAYLFTYFTKNGEDGLPPRVERRRLHLGEVKPRGKLPAAAGRAFETDARSLRHPRTRRHLPPGMDRGMDRKRHRIREHPGLRHLVRGTGTTRDGARTRGAEYVEAPEITYDEITWRVPDFLGLNHPRTICR
jgi:hypothetical protein